MPEFKPGELGTTKAGVIVAGCPDLVRIYYAPQPYYLGFDSFVVNDDGYLQLVKQDARATIVVDGVTYPDHAIQMTTGLGSPNSAGVFPPGGVVYCDYRADLGNGSENIAPRQEFTVPGEAPGPLPPTPPDGGTPTIMVGKLYNTGVFIEDGGQVWVKS